MGGSHDSAYPGGQNPLQINIAELAKEFPLNADGLFGEPGTGNSQVIKSQDPLVTANHFFDVLSQGADIGPMPDGKEGQFANFSNVTFVSLRPTSSDGSPSLLINLKRLGQKMQKIHFEKKE